MITSHSPAFLNVDGEARFIEVRRTAAGHSDLQPFLPVEVNAYSDLARDIGLDRGELLTNTRVLLFVEGRHDQVVLEEIFAARFHRAGIVVVPIGGTARHPQIVEHEVLIRFTTALVAVVFDKLSAASVQRRLDDPAFREEAMRGLHGKNEPQAMAALLHNAATRKRKVQPFPLPVDDIFDALDDEIITGQFPEFPGHAEARRAFAATKHKNRKLFYEERYGVVNGTATYKRLGAVTYQSDRISEPLRYLAD